MFQYLIPEYIDDRGDCSRLKQDDKELIIEKEMNCVLRNLYKERCLDLSVIKKKCSFVLNQKNIIPLYLGKNEVIMPVKLRKPRAKADSLYGYINIYFVDKIQDEHIILKDKSSIRLYETKRSVLKRSKMAKKVENDFCENEKCVSILKGSLAEPATREDIAILLMEIERIKKDISKVI